MWFKWVLIGLLALSAVGQAVEVERVRTRNELVLGAIGDILAIIGLVIFWK
jgi:hypothetical protein